jgi:hypothetical protein
MIVVNQRKPRSRFAMLASDLVMDVRASRSISPDQVERLERLVFGSGAPSGDQLDLLFLIDTYLQGHNPRWAELLARAAMSALVFPPERRTAA